jgi:TrmH family RNA methyltransferase
VITSKDNPKIVMIRKLLGRRRSRSKENAFVLEGVRLVEEAFLAGSPIQFVLFSDQISQRGKALVRLGQERQLPVYSVSGSILNDLANTETPQGILAVCSYFELSIPQQIDFALICDGIKDPGNLGTLMRTALAAGVQCVFVTPGVVDPFSPKVLRSAMGAHFHLPLRMMERSAIFSTLRSQNPPVRLFISDVDCQCSYRQIDFRLPTGIIIGGEAEGAFSEDWPELEGCVKIPMPSHVESLNAAIAGGILLFEVVHQRMKL